MICVILFFLQPQVLLPLQCLFCLGKDDAYTSFYLSYSKSSFELRSSWVTRRKENFQLHSPERQKTGRSKKVQKICHWFAFLLRGLCDRKWKSECRAQSTSQNKEQIMLRKRLRRIRLEFANLGVPKIDFYIVSIFQIKDLIFRIASLRVALTGSCDQSHLK